MQDSTILAAQRTELVDISNGRELRQWIKNTSRSIRREQLRDLDLEQFVTLWRTVGTTAMAQLLESLRSRDISNAVRALSESETVELLAALNYDRTANALRNMDEDRANLILSLLPSEYREAVDELLSWPAESAGATMTPNFLWLPASLDAATGITQLRAQSRHPEATSYLYPLDDDEKLVGVLSFHELITADPRSILREIANPVSTSVEPTVDREAAANHLYEHDIKALPVVDDGSLRGVITAEKAAEIMATETTEDFQRMSAATDLKTTMKDASIWLLYRSRVGWLVILVFGNIFSGAGIAYYENLIEQVVALVFFLPLLIDSGGNAGSQSATLMVRALATGQAHTRDWVKMLSKELAVALLLGLSMAAAVSVIGFWRGGAEVALVVSLTMIAIVAVGCLIGMSLPFLLTKLNMDPASASAPLITSICDGVGVLVYFFIASQILL
ncbi:MAG TPA: magnesium transporter [Actinomycetales bacterium]|nr:magnesium transporter [Actinomycetales bacterium]